MFRQSIPVLAILILALSLFSATSALAVQLGSFDSVRGGTYSVYNGSKMELMRSLLVSMFPETTYSGTSTLTPEYLAGVDLLILTVAYDETQTIAPLSAAEQSALLNFVRDGGSALILGERTSFGQATTVNPTFLEPFGMTIVGGTTTAPRAPFTDPFTVPFAAGPFGFIWDVLTIFPGWFGDTGTAVTAATLASNGQPVLAYFPEDALGPGSGRVIVSADSDIYTRNPTLVVNSFHYLTVPEPTSVSLALTGVAAITCVGFHRRKRCTMSHGRSIAAAPQEGQDDDRQREAEHPGDAAVAQLARAIALTTDPGVGVVVAVGRGD